MGAVRLALACLSGRVRSEHGWTLTEMMIAILISTFVLGAASTLLTGVASLNGTTTRQIQAQDDARRAVDHLTTQLRNATGPPTGTPIYSPASGSAVGTTDVVFYVPTPGASTTNNPRGLQWVRYCLDYSNTSNEKLYMQTNAYVSTSPSPPSTASCPSGSWTTSQLVVSNITGMEATASPSTAGCTSLSTPAYFRCPFLPGVTGGVTRDMRTKLVIKGDSARSNTTITSSLTFRNVKIPPTASMSCRVQNKHIICDASASADPDGQSISYQWKRTGDATWETGQSTYLFDSGALSSGNYTVTLRVTDSDGLYTDATQAVTV
jgi:type II secretory pathway pseudopilin PulG